jgi:hypothetical protein
MFMELRSSMSYNVVLRVLVLCGAGTKKQHVVPRGATKQHILLGLTSCSCFYMWCWCYVVMVLVLRSSMSYHVVLRSSMAYYVVLRVLMLCGAGAMWCWY